MTSGEWGRKGEHVAFHGMSWNGENIRHVSNYGVYLCAYLSVNYYKIRVSRFVNYLTWIRRRCDGHTASDVKSNLQTPTNKEPIGKNILYIRIAAIFRYTKHVICGQSR